MGWLARLFGKRELDERLLKGELSFDSGEGRARAERLTSKRHRAKCAEALRDLVEEAQKPHSSIFNANLRIQRALIVQNQALFLALARDLEEQPTVDPRGVILAGRLIEDGESPVYTTEAGIDENGMLVKSVERARQALKPG